MKYFILLLSILPSLLGAQVQLGSNFTGASESGGGNVFSGNGEVFFAAGGNQNGPVRAYVYEAGVWNQVGNDIEEVSGMTCFGCFLSANYDGKIVVVGDPDDDNANGIGAGTVRIYEFDGTSWNQKGGDINGASAGIKLGYSVDMTSDGERIVIGAGLFSDIGLTENGQVYVYDWNSSTSSWDLSETLAGTTNQQSFGHRVNISADGTVVGVASKNGGVRVYEESGGSFSQIGGTINAAGSYPLGTEVITDMDMSANGYTLVFGSSVYTSGGNQLGRFYLYDYIAGTNSWVLHGAPINGNVPSTIGLGHSVGITADGTKLIVGCDPALYTAPGVMFFAVYDRKTSSPFYDVLYFTSNTAAFGGGVNISGTGHRFMVEGGSGGLNYSRVYGDPSYPGGVSAELQLWVKSDVGVHSGNFVPDHGQTVDDWVDQTGNRASNFTPTGLDAPMYSTTKLINYHPSIEFDGTDDGLHLGGDYIFADNTKTGMNLFFVVQPAATASSKDRQYLADFGAAQAAGIGFAYSDDNAFAYAFSNSASSTFTEDLNPALLTYTLDFGTAIEIHKNGNPTALASTLTPVITEVTAANIAEGPLTTSTEGPFTLGRQCKDFSLSNSGGRLFQGNMVEAIVYSADNTTLEQQQIESYLALKYGISLGKNYISSKGTTLYDISTCGTSVVGIGRDDFTLLAQKQSKTASGDCKLYMSTESAMNRDNRGVFTDDEAFLIVGHDDKTLASEGSTEYPSGQGIYSRVEREYKMVNTNFEPSFSIELTAPVNIAAMTAADLRLLVDTDSDFSNATVLTPNFSVSGNVITITGLTTTEFPKNATRFFTIASINSRTTLPLNILNLEVEEIESGKSLVSWKVELFSEISHFVVQRSRDGIHWDNLGTVEYEAKKDYTYVDEKTLRGYSYYRLVEVDVDGEVDYSEMRSLFIGAKEDWIGVYPNPVRKTLYVKLNNQEETVVKIFNTTGQLLDRIETQTTLLEVDCSDYPCGMLFMEVEVNGVPVSQDKFIKIE